MAILPIYNCFHPVLRKKTEEVTEFDNNLKKLVDDMYHTMYATGNGVGLAANQVGISKSLFIVDLYATDNEQQKTPITLINPVIEFYSDELIEEQEGCLSIPLLYEKVQRSELVTVKYYDINEKEHRLDADDFLARVIQHEYDHLNGILFFERISALKRALLKGKLKKIEQGGMLADYPMILPDGSFVEPNEESIS